MGELTHLDDQGQARMVDVTAKPWTQRIAVARGAVATSADPTRHLVAGSGFDPLVAARHAGIAAAKRAWDLIPLCHPIQLTDVDVQIDVAVDGVRIEATTVVIAPTGVEMEALTACMFAGLSIVQTLWDVDPDATVTDVAVWSKSGGKSGDWVRGRWVSDADDAPPTAPTRGE